MKDKPKRRIPFQLVAYEWHVATWIYTSLKCTTTHNIMYVFMFLFFLCLLPLFLSFSLSLIRSEHISFAGFCVGFSKSHSMTWLKMTGNWDNTVSFNFLRFSFDFLVITRRGGNSVLLWSNSLSVSSVYLTEFLFFSIWKKERIFDRNPYQNQISSSYNQVSMWRYLSHTKYAQAKCLFQCWQIRHCVL